MRKAFEIAIAPIGAARTNFYSIDLLRGLAAISVLIFHFKNFAGGGGSLSRAPGVFDGINLLRWLAPIRENGSLAVMLFWAISGFVFMNVYAGTKPESRQFWVNRIARLYPLHFLTLLIILAIQILAMQELGHWLIYPDNDLAHFLPHLLFASAWSSAAPHSFNGPIWSVSVEVLIYAVFYLYARFTPANLLTAAAGVVVAMAFEKLFPASQIPVCGAFFFGGMLAYGTYHLWSERRRPLLLAAAVTGLVVFAAASLKIGGHIPLTVRLLPIFCCLLVAAAASEELALRNAYRKTQFVGNITYSTYLWHSPLQMLFLFGAGLGWWGLDIAFTDIFFLAYLAVVCGFAHLSFHYIERPSQRWVRERMLRKSRDKPLISAP